MFVLQKPQSDRCFLCFNHEVGSCTLEEYELTSFLCKHEICQCLESKIQSEPNHHCCPCMYLCVCFCVSERHGELVHTAVTPKQEWNRTVDGRGGQGARTQLPVSSVGDDRAILLGFTMMAFSVLMFFVVGITTVKPYVNRYSYTVHLHPNCRNGLELQVFDIENTFC